MNSETMLERIEAGYDPVDISLEKWYDGENLNSDLNCALCRMYRTDTDVCTGCPLVEIGERCMGIDSAYHLSVRNETTQPMIDALLKAKEWQRKQDCKGLKKKPKQKQWFPSAGDRVRIVDIHEDDSYSNNTSAKNRIGTIELIGKIGILEGGVDNYGGGYFGVSFVFDYPIQREGMLVKTASFFKVKLEPVAK